MPQVGIPWWPQPRQAELLKAAGLLETLTKGAAPKKPKARVIGYGGAAGGGKSDADLGLAITWALAYPGSQIAFFRREFTELEGPDGAIMRSHELLAEARQSGLVSWNGQNHRWTWRNGSVFQFCHCHLPKDVYGYQSSRFDLFIVDEATHFLWPMIDYLMTRNGPTVDCVPAPLAVFTTNPGNVGHLWFKSQFIDLQPWGQPVEAPLPSGETETHLFILAKLEDNPILDQRAEGEYRQTLMKRDPTTRKALLDANWNIFVGQMFQEWEAARHVVPARELPKHWPVLRGVDWGYSAPFCCLWGKRDPDTGRVIVYREAYETGLTDRQQARLIKLMTPTGERAAASHADPSMWTKKAHEEKTFSTADEYAAEGIMLTPGDNNRVMGVRKIHTLLANLPDGWPGLQVMETCPNLIRTLPALVRDVLNPDDVDSEGEDHAFDALKYMLTPVRPKTDPARPLEPEVDDPILKRVGLARRATLKSRDL